MQPTDFAKHLSDFLTKYMPAERGASGNTIKSYKDTFILFLVFCRDCKNINANRLTLEKITKELVVDFLEWLESERGCSAATRNVRLAALHSFFRYLQYITPQSLLEWQSILAIPVKKTQKTGIKYLQVDAIKAILAEPDQSTRSGRRDVALLSLLYDSAARVQELIDLTPAMIRLDEPCTVKLIGKGGKARIVPMMLTQVELLKKYMIEQQLLEPYANQYPLFSNSRKEKLTRAGVNYILNKYARQVSLKHPSLIPEKLSCHTFRHSKSMHLLQAGVNLVYIRDILGHTSVQVTEIYARTDSKQKREAIEKAYTNVVSHNAPSWLKNDDLLSWLKEF